MNFKHFEDDILFVRIFLHTIAKYLFVFLSFKQ